MQRLVAWLAMIAVCATSAGAQSAPAAAAPERRFAYEFQNFVWWRDADLRLQLKQRLPGLGDTLASGSRLEARIRLTLEALLKKKGITAEVQIIEPPLDIFQQKHAEDFPPPAIIFTFPSPPTILVEKLVLDNPPFEAAAYLKETTDSMQGKPFARNFFWQRQIQEKLLQLGYLQSNEKLEPGEPKRVGATYLVPVVAAINAGPQYHVSTIEADGGPLVEGKDLSSYFTRQHGDVAVPDPFGRLSGLLRSVYWHAGYPDVAFSGSPVLDSAKALASYRFVVIPGNKYQLRSIKIRTLTPAQEVIIKDIFPLKEGDTYDALAVATFSQQINEDLTGLKGYGMGSSAKEDKQEQVVDLTLLFNKR